jgi:hypothetical protein
MQGRQEAEEEDSKTVDAVPAEHEMQAVEEAVSVYFP